MPVGRVLQAVSYLCVGVCLTMSMGRLAVALGVEGVHASASYVRLTAKPALGRPFAPDDA
jgi:hypothetical protein